MASSKIFRIKKVTDYHLLIWCRASIPRLPLALTAGFWWFRVRLSLTIRTEIGARRYLQSGILRPNWLKSICSSSASQQKSGNEVVPCSFWSFPWSAQERIECWSYHFAELHSIRMWLSIVLPERKFPGARVSRKYLGPLVFFTWQKNSYNRRRS